MIYQTPIGPHDGDSWEKLCQVCLNIRFQGSYIEVPASPGDYGIDGFTRDGDSYQCYCPERECSDKDLYESQREKIHDDTKKLEKNKVILEKLFQGIKLKRWFFLTPKISKNDLIIYCNSKSKEIKALKLPFIDDSFVIIPVDYKFLAAELDAALNTLDYSADGLNIIKKLELGVEETKPEEIDEYKNDIRNNVQASNALRKHTAMFPQNGNDYSDRILKRVDRTVGDLLLGDHLLKEWEVIAQEQLERFGRVVKALEKNIEELCETPASNNVGRYQEIKTIVKDTIDKEFKSLSETTRIYLSDRVVADWLLRCPLNFE